MSLDFSLFDAFTMFPLAIAFLIAAGGLVKATIKGRKVVQWIRALGALTASLLAVFYFAVIFMHIAPIEVSPTTISCIMQSTRIINTLLASLFLIWAFGWHKVGEHI